MAERRRHLPAGADAAGGEHRRRRDRVDDLGPQHDRCRSSPVWPPPSVPWAMMMSTPASLCARACLAAPQSAATSRPVSWISSMISSGGVPSALAISFTFGWRERARRPAGRGRRGPAEQLARRSLLGKLRHAVVGEDLAATNSRCCSRDHVAQRLLELLRVDLAHALVLAGDDDVDAVGLVADVLVDPVELDLELLGREADRAEHAEPAGLASPPRPRRGSG